MKRVHFLLMVVFLLSAGAAVSQECKTEKDPFTGEKVVTANLGNRWVYFENKAGKTKFEIMFSYAGSLNTLVPKGTEILMKLKSGDVLKLHTVSDAHPKLTAGIAGVFSGYTFETELEKVEINKLSLDKVVLIRFPDLKAGGTDLDPKAPGGKGYFKAIMKSAKYLMKNI